MNRLRCFFSDRSGATAVEYGLVAAIISIALISGFGAVSSGMNNTLMSVENSIQSKPK